MKLRTILTLPAATPQAKAGRVIDNLWAWTARRLPGRLRYESLIICGVRATHDDEVVTDVRFMDVLDRTPRGGVNR